MVNDERRLLEPLGRLYGEFMNVRNYFYDKGIFAANEAGCPVISVGNLTVGGAGKTPVVMAILKKIIANNKKPAVVSRGYGRSTGGVMKVDFHAIDAATLYGDEPVLIQSVFPEVPVYVGARRIEVAKKALAENQVDVILADDAFQHRSLARRIDIVVIDSTQELKSLNPIPWGMAREKSSALKRATIVILNKVNLAPPDLLQGWQQWLRTQLRADQVLVEAGYRALPLQTLLGVRGFAAQEWIAVAGIARPEPFLKLLKQELKLKVTTELWFKDHHQFTEQDLKKVEAYLLPGQGVVITEKDAVKWRGLKSGLLEKVAVAGLELEWLKNEEALDHALTTAIC